MSELDHWDEVARDCLSGVATWTHADRVQATEQIAEVLRELATERDRLARRPSPEAGWVSVEDRLPEHNTPVDDMAPSVLVFCDSLDPEYIVNGHRCQYVAIRREYDDGRGVLWYHFGADGIVEVEGPGLRVTHWRRLPAGPEGEAE